MHNITLICTEHGENGACNIHELYRIIESINPEIIFEEIPPSVFDAYYKDKNRSNLETSTITKYLESHQIEHIPIDNYNVSKTFFDDNAKMHKKVEANSLEYRTLIDTHSQYIKQYGFKYLNSIYCDNIINDLYNAIENTLNKLNDDKLLQTYKLWNEVNDKREDEMINNIYNYSKKNKFDNGLFFIGAAHRNSIISKIVKYIKSGSIEVTWNYSNYDKIFY